MIPLVVGWRGNFIITITRRWYYIRGEGELILLLQDITYHTAGGVNNCGCRSTSTTSTATSLTWSESEMLRNQHLASLFDELDG
jgi:hypothetical protein